MKLGWVVAVMVGLALGAKAQEQDAAPVVRQQPGQMPSAPTLTVQSRLVSVAMNVTDAAGAPVSGFSQDDFELLEDGKPVKMAVFEAEASTPLEIVIAVDASESVYGEKGLEREAMRSFVKSLVRPQDELALMAFSDAVDMVVPFTNDTRRIDGGFGKIERGESTALYDAIYLAGEKLAAQPLSNGQRRVIVLITDGEDTTRHGSYAEAIEQAERAGAMVYSLIVVPVEADAGRNVGGEHALIQMARDTGGKFYELVDRKDVGAALKHVSEDLRTQYTVGYYAPHKALGDTGLRHIEIRFKDPAKAAKYTLRYRTAYYAR